ncbi:MAG: hypothetical protein ACM3JH_06555 [Acidithiobacillales bacterium]
MKIFLESEAEIVCQSGFAYLPLLFDPSVASEIGEFPRSDLVIRVGGRPFVRTIALRSLVESCEALFPGSREALRRPSLRGIPEELMAPGPVVDERLKTILFSVMPRFVRRGKSLERKRLSEDEVLDLIGERLGRPGASREAARRRPDPMVLRQVLVDLERRAPAVGLPPEGRMPARALADWLSRELTARILEEERRRLTRLLETAEEPGGAASGREAILLAVARRGALEIDGFGFLRTSPGDDYLIYKRTGEYVLTDYYGRLYLFPDCRVAVSTGGALRPFVVETYKHPFLEAHDSGQKICLRRPGAWSVFSAAAVVEALEEGIGALLHGYSSRRRNGYHSLEGLLRPVATPVPADTLPRGPADHPVVRRKHLLDVDFNDYRIPADHPKVASGQVPVTNSLLP